MNCKVILYIQSLKEPPMKNSYYFIALLLIGLSLNQNCKNPRQGETLLQNESTVADTTFSGIVTSKFTDTLDGKEVRPYILKNANGMEAVFTNYGQRLISLMVPDRNGHFEDVVLGFDSLTPYTINRGGFFGATVGRYGNRIGGAAFELDGTTYHLAKNSGENHIHGGNKGFESMVWDVDSVSKNHIAFHRISPDMEEGYPGNLDVHVSYTLSDENALIIDYRATTDKKTPVNLTNHSYFNLKGAGEGDVATQIMQINADSFTPVDEGLIPTGEIRSVQGTPLDFRQPKAIGQDMEAGDKQMRFGHGYDHNFVLNKDPGNADGPTFAARVVEPQSGRVMEVYTTEPGVQFYGGNFLSGQKGKNGKTYIRRGAFCLETQHFPDSPNRKEFPSTILSPGELYHTTTIYAFDTMPSGGR